MYLVKSQLINPALQLNMNKKQITTHTDSLSSWYNTVFALFLNDEYVLRKTNDKKAP